MLLSLQIIILVCVCVCVVLSCFYAPGGLVQSDCYPACSAPGWTSWGLEHRSQMSAAAPQLHRNRSMWQWKAGSEPCFYFSIKLCLCGGFPHVKCSHFHCSCVISQFYSPPPRGSWSNMIFFTCVGPQQENTAILLNTHHMWLLTAAVKMSS